MKLTKAQQQTELRLWEEIRARVVAAIASEDFFSPGGLCHQVWLSTLEDCDKGDHLLRSIMLSRIQQFRPPEQPDCLAYFWHLDDHGAHERLKAVDSIIATIRTEQQD